MSAKIHSFDSHNQQQNNQYRELIDNIHNCLNEQLSDLLANMFNGADDVLFHLAENAESNEQQTQYFDTMRMLRTERKTIGKNFADALKNYLKPISLKEKETSENNLADDELTLVDQDTMEEMVAIASMHSKAMNLFGEAVNHLEARLEVLSMKTASIFDKQAIIPKHICESFQQALEPIELHPNNKIILYKLFDQEVSSRLAKMYQMLNKLLIDADILPQISLGKISRQKQSTPLQAQPETDLQLQLDTPAHSQTSPGSYTQGNGKHSGATQPVGYATGSVSQQTSAASTDNNDNITHGNGGHPQYSAYNGTPEENVTGAYHLQNNTQQTANNTPQQQIHNVIHQFMHGEIGASNTSTNSFKQFTPSGVQQGQYYDKKEVVKTLSNLQFNYASSNNPALTSAEFKRAIMKDMGNRNGGAVTKQVNQIDERTIDFIEMLFEAITEDNSISDLITNLLLRLQIPVIKAAMLDEKFFEDGEHPARYTLNLIAHIGKGINSDQDSLYIQLDSIIKQLLDEYDVDISSFEKTIDKLNLLIQQEDAQQIENEIQAQKEVLQNHARQVVLTELQHHSKNKVLPKPVQPLILKHWSTLLFHHYIKTGKDSNEWHDTVSLLKLIIKSLQPIQSEDEWASVNKHHQSLTDTIRETLYDTKQNRDEIDSAIQALHETYETMLESSDFKPDEIILDITEDSDEEADFSNIVYLTPEDNAPSPVDIEAEQAEEKLSKLPDDIRPGVWFEIYTGEESAVRRLKLSVIIIEEARLIFVDRIGVKKMEKDADEFAAELESGKSTMIADHSVFDNALGNVINSLFTSA